MIYNSEDNVREMFRYHPVDSPERAEEHDNLNIAAQAFAVEVFKSARELHDYSLIEDLINQIQGIRMVCNLHITYKYIAKKKPRIDVSKYLTEVLEDDMIE